MPLLFACVLESNEENEPPFEYEQSGLLVVRIYTPDKAAIDSKTKWLKHATLSVSGADDEPWSGEAVETSIRGRGNSTWSQPKKPYALKLKNPQGLFGMPSHKRWVLLANYLDTSFLKNHMAFYLSERLGMAWTVHGAFVDLLLNDEYQGMYWIGEAIKVDENRVSIDDSKDFLIELDVYFDEEWKFYSPVRNLPYMIKNDDFMTEARLEYLSGKIAELEALLYPDDCSAPDDAYASRLDIVSWAQFYLVNAVMGNGELNWPKSCYFTFDSANGLLRAGPVWDFDWAALRPLTACNISESIYFDALLKSPAFCQKLKEIWAEYSGAIDIAEEIERVRPQIRQAALQDISLWGNQKKDSPEARFSEFDEYVDFLKATLLNNVQIVADFLAAL